MDGKRAFRVREVDISEIPEHLITNLKNIRPNGETVEEAGGLTAEELASASGSSKGGVWILQCPKDVCLGTLLTGKKLVLEGCTTLAAEDEEDDEANLTQYMPDNALGANIKERKFEAMSVTKENIKGGVALLLPEDNNFKMVAAPVNGHIIIRESIEELAAPEIEIPKSKPRKLPKGIKERHPVYGADFTSILAEMESSEEGKNHQEGPSKKKKSKKRK